MMKNKAHVIMFLYVNLKYPIGSGQINIVLHFFTTAVTMLAMLRHQILTLRDESVNILECWWSRWSFEDILILSQVAGQGRECKHYSQQATCNGISPSRSAHSFIIPEQNVSSLNENINDKDKHIKWHADTRTVTLMFSSSMQKKP